MDDPGRRDTLVSTCVQAFGAASDRVYGVDQLRVPSLLWDPANEMALSDSERKQRADAAVAFAQKWIFEESVGRTDTVAIVTHSCVIKRIFGQKMRNAAVLRVVLNMDGSIRCVERVSAL